MFCEFHSSYPVNDIFNCIENVLSMNCYIFNLTKPDIKMKQLYQYHKPVRRD